MRTLLIALAALAAPSPVSAMDLGKAHKAAIACCEARKPREAISIADAALVHHPKDAWLHLIRGSAYSDLREFTTALEAMDRAMEIDPKIPQVWMNRGNICQRVGRYRQAIWHYRKALELAPPAWLEKRLRNCIATSEANQEGVLKGKLRVPAGDVPKLAREAGAPRDPLAFWRRQGAVVTLSMRRTETLSGGRERVLYSSMRCVRINMPMGPEGNWVPLPVFIPLERGEILFFRVPLDCAPGVAILEIDDPIGVRTAHVKCYMEWLYLKSGL